MLDFSIYCDQDRVTAIQNSIPPNPTAKELETYANYILYGKGSDGKSLVDKKEIQIQTKYSSYAKKKVDSLESILENPVFDERQLKPIHRQPYTNPKPKINKSNPALELLLEEISKWEEIYNKGLEEWEKYQTLITNDPTLAENPDTPKPTKNQTQLYKLKHFLIELKKQQYVIQEVSQPTKSFSAAPLFAPIFTSDIALNVKPLGIKTENSKRFQKKKIPKEEKDDFISQPEDSLTPSIDFTNPTHVYQLIENYQLLVEESIKDPTSSLHYILDTLEWYIERANFDPVRTHILQNKKFKIENSTTKTQLSEKFNTNYNENYISTIYTKEISRKIAEAASIHLEEWENRQDPSKWKKCSKCGEEKLRTSQFFMRKKSSGDGLSARCKDCEKAIRLEKKKKGELSNV